MFKQLEFRSIANPGPSEGLVITDKKAVVPNQSMSLQEILERFTRGESLEIGREANYDDGPEDLEKMSHADLVDKAEFVDKLKQTAKDYDRQEKAKAKKEAERIYAEAAKKAEEEVKKAAEKAAESRST